MRDILVITDLRWDTVVKTAQNCVLIVFELCLYFAFKYCNFLAHECTLTEEAQHAVFLQLCSPVSMETIQDGRQAIFRKIPTPFLLLQIIGFCFLHKVRQANVHKVTLGFDDI